MMTQRYNTGGVIGGSILIGLGLLFLLAQFFNIQAWDYIWPFFVIAVGGLFFVGMLAGGKSAAALAIPGSIIGVIGLMLFVQNISGHWNSWAYGWTIILMAVGLGLWISGQWGDNPGQKRAGWRLMQIGFLLFVIFGAFFELVIFGYGGTAIQQAIFPVLLILTGLYLVLRRTGLWPSAKRASELPAANRPDQPPQA